MAYEQYLYSRGIDIMDTERIALIIISIIFGAIGIISFRIAYRQYKEKGFIFTNTWLFASEKERENMDIRIKKAEYRVGRNVFFLLGLVFIIYAVYFQLWLSWISYIGFALMGLIVIYALYQWVANARLFKSIEDEKNGNRTN